MQRTSFCRCIFHVLKIDHHRKLSQRTITTAKCFASPTALQRTGQHDYFGWRTSIRVTSFSAYHQRVHHLHTSRRHAFPAEKDHAACQVPEPEFDWEYLCDPNKLDVIRNNIQNRKGVGDIDKVVSLWKKYKSADEGPDREHLRLELIQAAADIPNRTHPSVPIGDETENRLVEEVGRIRDFTFTPWTHLELGKLLHGIRTEQVGVTMGSRSYYLIGDFARLEQALIQYTVDQLLRRGFSLVSVPDLVHPSIIEGCGFKTAGDRTQVYSLEPSKHGEVCLSGTGEMPIAGLFMKSRLPAADIPHKVATVSRCFRAETSDTELEKGIYRVHHFSKVEMFILCANETGNESEALLADILDLQKSLFSQLHLPFRVLDMSSQELGAPAYRKYDIEAWMPAKNFWGEISSTSSCIDFQSRRLDMKYWSERNAGLRHLHTLNGTACALPRMIMAIVENFQTEAGHVNIPAVLQPYMGGQEQIRPPDKLVDMRWIRFTKGYKKQMAERKSS